MWVERGWREFGKQFGKECTEYYRSYRLIDYLMSIHWHGSEDCPCSPWNRQPDAQSEQKVADAVNYFQLWKQQSSPQSTLRSGTINSEQVLLQTLHFALYLEVKHVFYTGNCRETIYIFTLFVPNQIKSEYCTQSISFFCYAHHYHSAMVGLIAAEMRRCWS